MSTKWGEEALDLVLANGQILYLGKVPGRKKLALGRQIGNTMNVLAYFTSERAAEEFLAILRARP